MSELAVRQERAEVAMTATPLTVWAESARQAATVAVSLARTPFVPASLRDRDDGVTAANITAAILTGQEIGLEPMAALRSIDLIQGTPALRAVALRAVVLAAGHDMYLVESTATRAIVRGVRKGSAHEQESVWTMDRARALGLVNKDNWKKQPAAMLVARATGECARLIAADALLGVPYASEELDDGIEAEASSVATVTPTRTARRRTAQAPAVVRPVVDIEPNSDPEPSFDEPDGAPAADVPEVPDDERMITGPQLKALHASLGEIGLGGAENRDGALEFMSRIIARNIESSKELTVAECSTILDVIKTGDYESA